MVTKMTDTVDTWCSGPVTLTKYRDRAYYSLDLGFGEVTLLNLKQLEDLNEVFHAVLADLILQEQKQKMAETVFKPEANSALCFKSEGSDASG